MKKLPFASPYEIALVFLGYRFKYVCNGNSMYPTIKNGETVLVDKEIKNIEIGDIVLAKHPAELQSEIIKRVERIDERGNYFLVGDNLGNSIDSRTFGTVTRGNIKGKVVARLG